MLNYKKLMMVTFIIMAWLCLAAATMAATTTSKTITKTLTATQTTTATIATDTTIATSTTTDNTIKTTSTSSNYVAPIQTKTISPLPEQTKSIVTSSNNKVQSTTVVATTSLPINTSIKELSPQPDPPGKQDTSKIISATSTKTLNPQPEPPKNKTDGQYEPTMKKPTYAVEIKAPAMLAAPTSTLGVMTTTTRATTSYYTGLDKTAWVMSKTGDSAEIRIKEKKISINSEKAVDANKISSLLQIGSAIVAPLESMVNKNYFYNVSIAAMDGAASVKFQYDGQEVSLPVSDDIKVGNKKLFLLADKDSYEVKILPPELYGQMRAKAKNSGAQVGQIKLQIKDKKTAYEIKLKEKFKLFGFLPMTISSAYTVEAEYGEVVTQSWSWYKFLGKMPSQTLISGLKLVSTKDQELQFMETEYPRVIIRSFTATPVALDSEYGPVRLAWNTENAHTIQINAEITNPYLPTPIIAMPVPTPASGYIDVYPNVKTKYTLVVSNRGGIMAERMVEVDVRLANIVITKVEPNTRTYSVKKGKKGYTDMDIVFRNIGWIDFLGIISVDEITGGDYHFLNSNFIADIQSGRELKYHFYRGELPAGMSPIENFVCGQTYLINVRYRTDKQPRWEYATDNNWLSRSVTIPEC